VSPATPAAVADPTLPFHDAKEQLVDAWEREYVQALLDRCGGNVSAAARQGGLNRAYLHRLLKKHRLG
jgi:transcriptional regulator of acetoin/glycerol metabolism